MTPVARFRAALEAFDCEGRFGEADYALLRSLLSGALGRGEPHADLLDGLLGLFFERHLMHDRRRAELLSMDDESLWRAVRHRFRQVVADENDEHRPYHALRSHVRDALLSFGAEPPSEAHWPAGLYGRSGFSPPLVEQAVCALWREGGPKPSAAQATSELFARYVRPLARADEFRESHAPPETMSRRLDAQRLASGVLELLLEEERELLRHLLDGGGVEEWAEASGCSRATAYRMLARLKALCRLELHSRSSRTRIEALNALRLGLKHGSGV
ncbi:MAG: hypothetical protein HYZ28_11035 [Myxococcales bacterium]|nr:hypothetical protein [Myxococcales bacterium]